MAGKLESKRQDRNLTPSTALINNRCYAKQLGLVYEQMSKTDA